MFQRPAFMLRRNQYHSCVMIRTSVRVITFGILRQVPQPNSERRSCSGFYQPARAGLGYFFSLGHSSAPRPDLLVLGFCRRCLGMTTPRVPVCSRHKCPCRRRMLEAVQQPTLPIEPVAHRLGRNRKSQVGGCLTRFPAKKVLRMSNPSASCGDS